MNPRLNVTQKTYYALGVLASVLNLAGIALYLAEMCIGDRLLTVL